MSLYTITYTTKPTKGSQHFSWRSLIVDTLFTPPTSCYRAKVPCGCDFIVGD